MATNGPRTQRHEQAPGARATSRPTALTGGLFLGLGLGGFIDGIFLHQIAQWHNMGSAILPPTTMEAMAQNMRWDGLFHVATLVLTLVGVVLLWREGWRGTAPRSLGVLTGQMILGWGIFNLVEGIIDHHLLELHHVRDMPAHVPAYDWWFLGIGGVLFIAIGGLLSRANDTGKPVTDAKAPVQGKRASHPQSPPSFRRPRRRKGKR